MRLCDLDEIKVCVDRQYENCHGYSGSKKAIYREAILAVKSILHSAKPIDAVTVQEWVSVKDRLPGTDGIYIVCDCRLNGNPWIHTAGFRKASLSWCELHGVYYDDGYGRYSEQDKITHWMPMPQPPKGE